MKHHKLLVPLVITVLLTSGCWDIINIEDRGFIIGTAIDLAEDDEGDPEFSVTNQLVLPQRLEFNPAGEGGGEGQEFQNLTFTGSVINRINDQVSTRSSKTPYFGHMKILIISDDLAKDKHTLIKLLDYYFRDVKIRRGVLIAVSKGDAKSILDFKEPESQLAAINLKQLLEQTNEHSGYFRPLTIGDVEQYDMIDRSFVLPYLQLKDHVERTAGAVFQGPQKKMVGTLDMDEAGGMEFFSGKEKQNLIDFQYKDEFFGLEIVNMSRKLSIDTSDISQLKIKNKLTVRGIIKEAKNEEDFMKKGELKKVEKIASKKIEQVINHSIDKAQNELNADIFNIWQELKMNHHDTWEKVEKDWESGKNYFSKADIEIEVDTDIYSTGTSNRTN